MFHEDDVTVNEEHKCEICEKVFNSKEKLKRHFTAVHDTIIRKALKCNICTNSFQTQQNLNLHIKTIHGGNKK